MRHQHAQLVVDDELEFEVPAVPPSYRFAPALRRGFAVAFLVGGGFGLGRGAPDSFVISPSWGIGFIGLALAWVVIGALLLTSGRAAAIGLTGAIVACPVLVLEPGPAWLAGLAALVLLWWIAPATYSAAFAARQR